MSDYNLGTARGSISIDGSAAQTGFAVAQSAAGSFFNAIDAKMESIKALGKRLTGVGAASAAGFGFAIKSAADFEFRMSAISAVSGATGKELDRLREKALKLGADTSFSATEAASAMEELVKAGLTVDDVLNGAAEATVALAEAGGTSLPVAAEIAANAMNQFGLSAEQVPRVADLLAGAANASSASVESLGQALSQAGAVANLAGLSLDDTTKALGQFASKGIDGSDAGTALKTMLTNLIPTTDRQIAKFKEMGLMTYENEKALKTLRDNGIKPMSGSLADARKAVSKYLIETKGLKEGTKKLKDETDKYLVTSGAMTNQFFDAKGNVKDLRGLEEALAVSTKGMTKEQKLANLEILFGTDAMRAAAIMADSGAKGYDKFSKSMEGITAADVAKKRMDNLKGSMEELSGSLETLRIKVGTPLLKPLTSLANVMTTVVTKIASAPKPVIAVLSVLGALATVFLLVAGVGLILLPMMLGLVASFVAMYIVRTLTAPIFALGKALIFQRSASAGAAAANLAFQKSVTRIGRVSKVAAIAVRLLGLSVKALAITIAFITSPVGLVIAAIVALVAIFVLLYKNNETFRNIVDKVWSSVKSAIGSVVNWFTGTVVPAFMSALGAIKDGFFSAINFIENNWRLIISIILGPLGIVIALVTKYLDQIKAGISNTLNAIVSIWKAIWGLFGPLVMAVFGFIKAIVMLGIALILAAIRIGLFAIKTYWLFLWNSLVSIMTTVWNLIKAAVAIALTALLALIVPILNLIKAAFSVAWNAISAATSAIWKVIQAIVSRVVRGLVRIVGPPIRAVLSAVIGAWNAVSSKTRAIWGGLSGAVSSAIGKVLGVARGIKSKITGLFSGAASWLVSAGAKIIQGLISGITSMISKATGAIKKVTDAVSKFVPGSPVRKGALRVLNRGKAGGLVTKMIADGINSKRNLVERAMKNISGLMATESAELAFAAQGTYASIVGSNGVPVASAIPPGMVRTPAVASKESRSGSLRMIKGTMKTDKGFDVYVRGVAQEVDEEQAEFENTIDRMGEPSNAF